MLGKQQRSVFFVLIGWLLAFVFIPTNEPITRLTDTRGVTSVMRSSWWRSSTSSVCLSSRWRQRRRSGSFIVSFRTEEDAVNYFYCHLSFIFAFYIIVEPLVHSDVRWFIFWLFFVISQLFIIIFCLFVMFLVLLCLCGIWLADAASVCFHFLPFGPFSMCLQIF